MAIFTYGTESTVAYDDSIAEHAKRDNLAYFDPFDYCMRLAGRFHTILPVVRHDDMSRYSY